MKNFRLFTLVLFVLIYSIGISQTTVIPCNTTDSLYKTIKSGQSASYFKTAYINEFALVEKSLISVYPQTSPNIGYKVITKISDIQKGNSDKSYDENSILGSFIQRCNAMDVKYAALNNTVCDFTAINPDDVIDFIKNGITENLDQKYLIEGAMVDVFREICAGNTPDPIIVKKPAVYLYPTENMKIDVKVNVNGHLTFTEPLYGNGWSVNVSPDGLIDNKYDYLFYEADLNKIELPNEGWIVEFKNLENWFNEYLPKFGLNEKEKNQFKEYWLEKLRIAKYYEIKLLDNKFLSENMDLIINPAPETIVRLNFYFKPLNTKSDIKTPEIKSIERKGFTVIEWGGINAGDLKMIP